MMSFIKPMEFPYIMFLMSEEDYLTKKGALLMKKSNAANKWLESLVDRQLLQLERTFKGGFIRNRLTDSFYDLRSFEMNEAPWLKNNQKSIAA